MLGAWYLPDFTAWWGRVERWGVRGYGWGGLVGRMGGGRGSYIWELGSYPMYLFIWQFIYVLYNILYNKPVTVNKGFPYVL